MKKLLLSLIVAGSTVTFSFAQWATFDAANLSQSIANYGQMLITAQQAMQEVQQTMNIINYAKNGMVPQLMALATQGSGSKGIAYNMAASVDLDSYGQILSTRPDGSTYTASCDDLSYDPNDEEDDDQGNVLNPGFTGGNYAYVQNQQGGDGLPCGLDDMPPCSVLPVSPDASNADGNGDANIAGCYSDPSGSTAALSSLFGSSAVTSLLGPLQSALSSTSLSAQSSQIGDGVFLRAYAGTSDDLQAAYGTSSSATDVMAYLAATTQSSSSQSPYHPIFGTSSSTAGQAVSGLLSNILTAGEYGAVNKYLQTNGGSITQNPYASSGAGYAPIAVSLLSTTRVGQPLMITPGATVTPAPAPVAPSLFARFNGANGASGTGTAGLKVVVVTLPKDQLNQYNNYMAMSDEMIRNNWEASQKAQALVNYSTTVLNGTPASGTPGTAGYVPATNGLLGQEAQLQAIRNAMAAQDTANIAANPNDANHSGVTTVNGNGSGQTANGLVGGAAAGATTSIAEVTQALNALQHEISTRQEFCSNMQLKIADLASQRSKLLQERTEKKASFAQGLPKAIGGAVGDSYVNNALNLYASTKLASSSSTPSPQ